MNVRFFAGTKKEYLSLAKHNPQALYFCADTQELYWGDMCLSDGIRVIATKADLPTLDAAADGIVYYVAKTRNAYTLLPDRSGWIQTIYAPVRNAEAVEESEIYETVTTVGAVRDIINKLREDIAKDLENIEVPELGNYALKSDLEGKANVEHKHSVADIEGYEMPNLENYATKADLAGFIKVIPDTYVTEEELATKGYITTDDIADKADIDHNHDDLYDAKGAAEAVKNELLNGAGDAFNTLKELGDLISDNVDAIEALESIAAGKADKEHEHDNYAAKEHEHTQYLTELPEHSHELPAHTHDEYLTAIPEHDHSEYLTALDIEGKADAEHTHENYADKDHEHSQYLTESALEGYAKTEDLFNKDYNELINTPEIPSVAGLASEEYVNEKFKSIEIPSTEGLATETFVTEEIAKIKIPDVSGFISEIPDEYVTETELNAKGYLTEHQDLSHLAEKDHVHAEYAAKEHEHDQYLTEHQDLSEYAKKSDIPSNYLTTIPDEYITGSELAEELAKIEPPTVSLDGYATEAWVNEQGYIKSLEGYATEDYVGQQIDAIDLSGYAKAEDIPTDYLTESDLAGYSKFSGSYNDLADKPEIPSVEGLASEEFVKSEIAAIDIPETDLTNYYTKAETADTIAAAVTEKADKVPFTTDKFVGKALGEFAVGTNIKDFTVAEILAKLLELTDEPGENPDTPDEPEEPTTIPDEIIANNSAMYQVNELGEVVEISYNYKEFTVDEYAAAPTQDCFYQLKDAEGNVLESGYQHVSEENDSMYYVVLLPKELDFATNVSVQSWDAIQNEWSYDNVSMSSDLATIEAAFEAAELTLPTYDAEKYTLWIDTSLDTCSGIDYRFIINE